MKRYTNEQKIKAVNLAEEIGPEEAAKKLRIHVSSIYGWKKGGRKRKTVVKKVDFSNALETPNSDHKWQKLYKSAVEEIAHLKSLLKIYLAKEA